MAWQELRECAWSSTKLGVRVYGHSSASLPEPWVAGPDTAGHRDLQTMFMTVGLLLGLAKKDRLYTQHTDTHRLAWSLAADTRV